MGGDDVRIFIYSATGNQTNSAAEMRRYTITEGARTTAGGTVIKASSNSYIQGVRVALENNFIFCSSCGRPGHILCVGPRLVELWNGVPVALENDLCICGCTPHPRLIANQSMRSQVVDEEAAAAHCAEAASDAAMAAASNSSNAKSFDLDFLVTNEVTGKPAIDWPYLIELANGARLEGRTDLAGKTKRVSAARAEHATLQVYEQDTTPINPYWDS
jgi:uncharacterized Zn-binding protein involved in type VI secretion